MSLIQDLLWAGAGGVVGNKMTEAVNHTIKTASTPPGEEPPPSDNDIRRAIVDMARRLDELARALSKESLPDVDTSIQIPVYPGAVTIPHFRPRRAHNMIFLPTKGVTLFVEMPNVGQVTIGPLPLGWVTLDFPEGIRLSLPQGTGTSQTVLYRASDNTASLIPQSEESEQVYTALAPYSGNPTQTANSGADTPYSFGPNGNTQFSHVSGQNNSGQTVYLAFDQSTTAGGDMVYAIANGQPYSFDRSGKVLHFSSATPVSFGGQSGITVEAFA